MFIKALNQNLNLQRFKILYVCGNYSGIFSKLDRRFTDLEVREPLQLPAYDYPVGDSTLARHRRTRPIAL